MTATCLRAPSGALSFPDWSDRYAVCIATGPALTQAEIDLTHQAHRLGLVGVIAVNDAGLASRLPMAAPWADMLYAADRTWWDYYEGVPGFHGARYCAEDDSKKWGCVRVPTRSTWDGFCYDPPTIELGGNSGFQALNVAIHCRPQAVILLGYNFGGSGRGHYFGNHPPQLARSHNYRSWLKHMESAGRRHAGREPVIFNATEGSAIQCFQKTTLRDLLQAN